MKSWHMHFAKWKTLVWEGARVYEPEPMARWKDGELCGQNKKQKISGGQGLGQEGE